MKIDLTTFRREQALMRKLLLDQSGVTTAALRRDAVRLAIIARGIADDDFRDHMTYRAAFESTYSEPLEPEIIR